MFRFEYELKLQEEVFGPPGRTVGLRIECLADLDASINALFAELERRGEARHMEKLCPYFGIVWPSARGLSDYLVDLAEDGGAVRGARVLELGCGLAIPSLVAAKLGANATAIDFHPDIPIFLERNIALNEIESDRLLFTNFDWRDADSTLGQFDLILGSEVLYDQEHALPVAKFFARHSGPTTRVLVSDPGRPYLQSFADEMQALGFVYSVSTRNVVGDAPKAPATEPQRKDVYVLDFTKSG